MVTAAVPGASARRPLRRWLDDAAVRVSRFLSPAKPVLKNLASIPLTTAGLGCADAAFWHLGTFWGLLITAVSLVLLEHLIADE